MFVWYSNKRTIVRRHSLRRRWSRSLAWRIRAERCLQRSRPVAVRGLILGSHTRGCKNRNTERATQINAFCTVTCSSTRRARQPGSWMKARGTLCVVEPPLRFARAEVLIGARGLSWVYLAKVKNCKDEKEIIAIAKTPGHRKKRKVIESLPLGWSIKVDSKPNLHQIG